MTKENSKLLRVVDTSCTSEYPTRTHSINLRGVLTEITFKYGEDKILPFEQGLKFAKIEGFKVEEVDGKTLVLPAVEKEGVKALLAADEVIAKLAELTLNSLKMRAGQKPGGEIFLQAVEEDKPQLIAFIIGQPPVAGPDETVISEVGTAGSAADLVEEDEGGAAGLTGELNEQLAAIRAAGPKNIAPAQAPAPAPKRAAAPAHVTKAVMTPEVKTEVKTAEMTPGVKTEFAPTETLVGTADGVVKASEIENGAGTQVPAGDERKFTLNEVKGATDEALELATAHGLSLEGVTGSGENGNVLKADVEAIIQQNQLKPVKAE